MQIISFHHYFFVLICVQESRAVEADSVYTLAIAGYDGVVS